MKINKTYGTVKPVPSEEAEPLQRPQLPELLQRWRIDEVEVLQWVIVDVVVAGEAILFAGHPSNENRFDSFPVAVEHGQLRKQEKTSLFSNYCEAKIFKIIIFWFEKRWN